MTKGTAYSTYSTGSVTSEDGTTIAYRRLSTGPRLGGTGPKVVLMHGSMMAAQNLMALGTVLSGAFIRPPLRRRRSRNGP